VRAEKNASLFFSFYLNIHFLWKSNELPRQAQDKTIRKIHPKEDVLFKHPVFSSGSGRLAGRGRTTSWPAVAAGKKTQTFCAIVY
jgi:hypothetical protein